MNSDQIVYTQPNGSAVPMQMGATSTTAHSYTVHTREERFLEKERIKETKRATKQERKADKIATKAGKL